MDLIAGSAAAGPYRVGRNTAGSRLGRACAAAVVLALVAVPAVGIGHASAESIGSVQASIADQEARIVAQSRTINRFTTEYRQA
ncbi:MAG: hypothetical protein J2O47_08990, partial [Acidimicrobiaceae bacterium]|nr:hypothetical protein [Acidimicrobiaceae bacterium]